MSQSQFHFFVSEQFEWQYSSRDGIALTDDLGLKLPNLTFLNMEFNMLMGTIPQSLGNCSHLDYLLMGFNYNISGTIPQALFQAQFISQLDLQFNSMSGSIPYQIRNLTSLQKAFLNNNQFAGSLPEELGMLASIQVLTLEHNSLRGNFPNQLFNCTSLMGLSLHDNNFIGPISSSIGFLKKLGSFDASSNKITGTLPLGLSNCSSLQVISLRNNMLSGQIPNLVIAGLAQCGSFNLAHNNLSGPIPNTEFQQMTFLQNLDLSYNQLSGLIPSDLSSCLDLHFLNLSQNTLVGSIPLAFGKSALLSLTDLDISHNSINGSIPQELGNLQSLQRLDLSDNALSGTIPSALAKLKGLQFLNLSYNSQLQGVIPKGGVFSNLTKRSFLGDLLLCGGVVNKTCPTSTGHSNHRFTKWEIVIIILGVFVLLAIIGFTVMRLRSRKTKRGRSSWDFDPYLRLTLDDIQEATRNFHVDNVLGVGVTGTVYKGTVKDGKLLAFKRFNLDSSSIHSFIGELQSVGLIRHRHLIRILGYVSNQLDANILILQYMPNGSLYDHLHGHEEGLSWKDRLRVAVDVADGLDYLHNDCPAPMIHCDLKPQNILFDENMEVRITDFGLAKVMGATTASSIFTDNMKGTFGYMAPELASYGHISRRCDVYSYGIVLMELITGRKPSEAVQVSTDEEDQGSNITLVQWVTSKLEGHEISDIVDKQMQESLPTENESNQMKELLNLAVKCTDKIQGIDRRCGKWCGHCLLQLSSMHLPPQDPRAFHPCLDKSIRKMRSRFLMHENGSITVICLKHPVN
ncbi:hypothetical protein GOP47_0002834 [Adiantum capillus-veneris]|uniref:Protein kinase domain-containing protein n=1 Tax=Adiantum capillus-veneris TaxID=13818 RepID=A0A9D4VCD1_ADICA|nr:hypothetical protein GOP47_0002834 [Adiantum capillus-veneris]